MTTHPQVVAAWDGLSYEINRATASLLCLLRGMEAVRDYALPWYNNLREDQRRGIPIPPSYLATAPVLTGPSLDLTDSVGAGGETEQLAFTGWIEELYNTIWEGQYRKQLEDALKSQGVVLDRVNNQTLGDIRLIRNDLVHNRRIANRSARCEVLKWFAEGDHMSLRIAHVLDFLNHMGLLPGHQPTISTDYSIANWTSTVREDDLLRLPTPNIVSVRVTFPQEEDTDPTPTARSSSSRTGSAPNWDVRHQPLPAPMRPSSRRLPHFRRGDFHIPAGACAIYPRVCPRTVPGLAGVVVAAVELLLTQPHPGCRCRYSPP